MHVYFEGPMEANRENNSRFILAYLDENPINDRGCFNLLKGDWPQLLALSMCTKISIKKHIVG